jgi:hypothetical protein
VDPERKARGVRVGCGLGTFSCSRLLDKEHYMSVGIVCAMVAGAVGALALECHKAALSIFVVALVLAHILI